METYSNTTPRTTILLLVLFFFLFVLSFLASFSSSSTDPNYLNDFCYNINQYASNSTYETNLNTLLSSLSSYSSSTSYHNDTVGQNPNTVYGHFYCRVDLTQDVCSSCVTTAATEILQYCPNRKIATIWYNECSLRYSNESFFSTFSESPAYEMHNTHNVSDAARFSQLWSNITNVTATEAASNSNRFATRQADFTKSESLYCLAQCSPDLSRNDCNECLGSAIAYLPGCCNFSRGGRVFNPSCVIRFEIYISAKHSLEFKLRHLLLPLLSLHCRRLRVTELPFTKNSEDRPEKLLQLLCRLWLLE